MKVIVTGGVGRLGIYTINELMSKGHEVVSTDSKPGMDIPCEFIGVDLRETERLRSLFKKANAVVHLARVRFPYTETGFDYVSHSWKTPDVLGDAERFNHNVAITYNVLAAAWEAEVNKIVLGSSLAVYGFYYPSSKFLPDYLPIDENHPLKPQDPYGLSKLIGESMGTAFTRKNTMQIASLRFSGIYTDETYAVLIERRRNPIVRGTGALWTYVNARDAAMACRLAIEASFDGHEAFNICAPTTIMEDPTIELIQRYLPTVRRTVTEEKGNWSGYAVEKAKIVLGFSAKYILTS